MVMEGFESNFDVLLSDQTSPNFKFVQKYENYEEHDVTTERGCRGLILKNWHKITLLHGDNADGQQVLRVLKRELDVSERAPKLKTVQNNLILLRKEKKIPGLIP